MPKKYRILLLFLACSVFLFSGWNIYQILSEYRQGEVSYEELSNIYISTQPSDDKRMDLAQAGMTAGVNAETNAGTNMESNTEANGNSIVPAGAADTAPITVDFPALLKQCPDVVGWIYCEGTAINYPVVQSSDNSYYLYRLLDGTENSSGSIFMDFRGQPDFSDFNTILYGHNMKNGSMFGSLENYKKQEYYDAHPVIYLLTPEQDYKIELLGGYVTAGDDPETYSIPESVEDRDSLIEKARKHSTFQCETEIDEDDRLVTLSTCDYDFEDARYVVVGVLHAQN